MKKKKKLIDNTLKKYEENYIISRNGKFKEQQKINAC